MTNRTPVLVVGGGPSGTALACELLRRGVECRVVEALPAPTASSKATILWPRSLEALQRNGAAEHILDVGNPLHAFQFYVDRKPLTALSFGKLDDSPFQRPVSIPQPETEAALRAALAEVGGKIEWGTKLVEVTVHDTHAEAVLEANGKLEHVECDWVIGADGARSVVRKGMGYSLEGESLPERFMISDCIADTPQARDRAHFYQAGPDIVGTIPLPGNLTRYFSNAPEDITPETLTMEHFQERIERFATSGVKLIEPKWMTIFTVHSRIAENYRKGRGLLIGDAAHINSPAGGQGINLGIQDAQNLGWKLAQVLLGRAPAQLLDTYAAERRPIAEEVIEDTERQTKAATLRNPAAIAARNAIFKVVFSSPIGRGVIVPGMAGFKVAYRGRGLAAPDVAWTRPRRGAAQAGDRLPDFRMLTGRTGESRGLHELVRSDEYVLLVLAGMGKRAKPVAEFDPFVERVRKLYGSRLGVHIVVPNEPRKPRKVIPSRPGLIIDRDLRLHRWLGVQGPAICLVRPDGYLGLGAASPDLSKLATIPGLSPDAA